MNNWHLICVENAYFLDRQIQEKYSFLSLFLVIDVG